MNNDHPLSIFTTDAHLIVRSWDSGLVRLSGIPTAAACGQLLTKLLPDIEKRGLLVSFERVLKEGEMEILSPVFHHYLIPCPPAQPSKYFEQMQQRVKIAPWKEREEIVGTIVTIEDVTARLEQERELALKLASADEQTRLKASEMLAIPENLQPEQTLFLALGDESWQVRQSAVAGLAKHGGTSLATSLLRSLRQEHNDLNVLNSVLQVLALSNIDVIPSLIECLSEPDADLRMYAALALGEQYDPRAIPPLLEMLADTDINVRYHAIDALGILRANEAVEALYSIALSEDFFLGFPAIASLTKIGDVTVAKRLVPLLKDNILFEPTIECLSKLGDEEVIVPLVTLLNTVDAPTGAIAIVLDNIYQRYEKTYGDGTNIVAQVQNLINSTGIKNLIAALNQHPVEPSQTQSFLTSLLLILGWLSGDEVEQALALLLGNTNARQVAIKALINYGTKVTNLVIEQLSVDDIETQIAAVTVLGGIGGAHAVPALLDLLHYQTEEIAREISFEEQVAKIQQSKVSQNIIYDLIEEAKIQEPDGLMAIETSVSSDTYDLDQAATNSNLAFPSSAFFSTRELAIAIVVALGQIGDLRAFEPLLDLLQSPDGGLRTAAISALNSLGHPEMPARMVTLLQDPLPYIRESAVKIAGYFAYSECKDLLLERCYDPDERVLRTAIEHIPYLESPKVLPTLAYTWQSKIPKVRMATVRAFGNIEPELALPYLLSALEDPDAWVRYYAARSIGQQGYPEAVEALAQLLDRDRLNYVRVAAVQALGRIGTEEAVAILAPLADIQSNGYNDLQSAVVAALGQIDRPQAIVALLDGLRSPNPIHRVDAIHALQKQEHHVKTAALQQEVVASLKSTAAADLSVVVAQAAIEALAFMKTPAAIEALLELTTDPGRRDACIIALTTEYERDRFAADQYLEIISRFLTHPHPVVRCTVVDLLTRLKHPHAWALLTQALSDSDSAVRIAVVTTLGHLNNRTAEEKLVALVRTDPDPMVRRAAQKVLQS